MAAVSLCRLSYRRRKSCNTDLYANVQVVYSVKDRRGGCLPPINCLINCARHLAATLQVREKEGEREEDKEKGAKLARRQTDK
mgnify:CR=1 FL=1